MADEIILKEVIFSKIEEMICKGEGPFSVVIADIDNFANVNNVYGKKIGNDIIRKLTSIFLNNLGSMDLVYRSGDEFTILLVNKGAERSIMEMEEIRGYLSDNIFTFTDGDINEGVYVTLSIGIASYPRDAKNKVELLRVADSAMFRAKKLGKNKVCLSEAESMVLKSSYFTKTQIDRLAGLSKEVERTEAFLIREAIDDLFKKYSK